MKIYLKTLLALLLAIACVIACVSCDGFDINSLLGSNNNGGETGDGTGDDEIDDGIDYDNSYRIKLVYSYTAVLENNAGRKEEKQAIKTIANIYVPHENNGFDDALKQEISNLTYHGYSFIKWYSEWNIDEQVGVTEFEFPEGPITGDMILYGYRGGLAGENVTWSVETTYNEVVEEGQEPTVQDVILTFSGEGPMFDFAYANAVDIPWYDYLTTATKVVFEKGVTTIGANSFNGFKKIKSVEFSDTIEVIGKNAFAYCASSSFRSITFPTSLKTISANAFIGAENLREVIFNDGLETIGDGAFYGARRIRSVVVPTSLKTVETGAFHPGMKPSSGINDHALKKVYYMGTAEQFKAIKINIDNIWFSQLPTIYEYYATPRSEGGAPDESRYPTTGSYWHYALDSANKDTTIPVQYCYAIRYISEGESSVPFVTHYVSAEPALDDNGNFVYDKNGLIVLNGIMTEELVEARNNIVYHGYKFVSFAGAPNVNEVITDDRDCVGVRGNILNADGGIVWEISADGLTLTLSLTDAAINGEASKEMWDVISAMDTTSLYSNITKITTVNISEGIEYLGAFALSGLTGLKTIILPASIKGVHEYAFDGCSNLLSIYYKAEDGVLANASECKVYGTGADGRVERDYNLTNGLSGTRAVVYDEIFEATSEFGAYWMVIDGKTIAWQLSPIDGGKAAITVGGDDEMVDFAKVGDTPWNGAKSLITSVSFTGNITSLGNNIFRNYTGVTSLSLPANLRVIPRYAFSGTGIVKNTSGYTNGLLVVDGHLLMVDASRDAEIFETQMGMITIASNAFDACPKIKTLYIASTIQYINSNRFSDVEVVYTDGATASWDYISRSAGFSAGTKVYFKSDTEPTERMSFEAVEDPDEVNKYKYYHKVNGEYVLWGCQHEFTEWEYKCVYYGNDPYYYYPTCSSEGIMTRHCIHDESHVQEWKVPKDSKAHSFVNYVSDLNGTCSTNETETAVCSNFGCKATDTREIENSKNPDVHTYGEPVDNGDETLTYTCTGCGHEDKKNKEN